MAEPLRRHRHRPDQARRASATTCRIAGLVREAAHARARGRRARPGRDIDAVVIGKAPDMFEGVMMPELYLADALGAAGKPMMRVHTAGSVGGSTALVAAQPRRRPASTSACSPSPSRSSRRATRCGRSRPASRSSRRCVAGAGGYFAPHHPRLHAALGRARRHRHPGRASRTARTRSRIRTRTCSMPGHHAREGRRARRCCGTRSATSRPVPSSDGACAMVLASEARGQARAAPAGVGARHGDAQRADDVRRPRPGQPAAPAATAPPTLYQQAGITNPRAEIDVAEIYVPFSWFEPMWLENLGFAEPRARAGR